MQADADFTKKNHYCFYVDYAKFSGAAILHNTLLALLMEVTLSMGLPFIWCFFQYTLRHSLFKIYKTKAFDDSCY